MTTDLAEAAATSSKIADGAVTSSKIADGAVTAAGIGVGAVGAEEIVANAVDASKVANGAVTGAKVLDGTISADDIAAGAAGAEEIAADAIDGSKVAGESLTTADLKGADVNGVRLDLKKGAVAKGGCADFDMAAAGAVAGEAVVISTQAGLPPGTVIYGVGVPSANVVTIKVCNLKRRGKMPAISGLPLRIITFG